MAKGDRMTPKSPALRGDGFHTIDSLASEFPAINVEEVREGIEASLKMMYARGYTGVEEEVEFDKDDLLVGTYDQRSLISGIGLRTKVDLMNLFSKLGEGRNFDAHFVYDPATRKGKISCTLKKHDLVPKMYSYRGSIQE